MELAINMVFRSNVCFNAHFMRLVFNGLTLPKVCMSTILCKFFCAKLVQYHNTELIWGMLNFFCQYFTHFRGQKNNLTRNIYFCTATISNVSGQKNNLSRNIIFWRGNIFNVSGQKNNLSHNIIFWRGNIFNVSGQKNNLSRNIIFWKGNIFNVSGNIYFCKGTIFVVPGKILFLSGSFCKGKAKNHTFRSFGLLLG